MAFNKLIGTTIQVIPQRRTPLVVSTIVHLDDICLIGAIDQKWLCRYLSSLLECQHEEKVTGPAFIPMKSELKHMPNSRLSKNWLRK